MTTSSSNTFFQFYNQRKRWAAKSTSYRDVDTIYVSLLVFVINFLVLFLFLCSFFDKKLIACFLSFIFFKFLIDAFFLVPVLRFFNRKELVKFIFPFELFYSFYIVLIPVLSYITSFTWKGRNYRK